MRTYIGTEVTLDTLGRIPGRNINRNTSLLVSGGSGRSGTVHIILECGYRQSITFLCAYLGLDIVNEINNVFSVAAYYCIIKAFVFAVLPAFRNFYLNNALSAGIDSCPVLHNNIFALTSVGSLCSSLHQFVCLLSRNDSGQFKECGLKDCVDTCGAHACFNTNLNTVDGVEVDVVLSDEFLHLSGQMLLQLFCIPCAVQQEGTAVNQLLNHVVLTYIRRIVACYEVSLTDQIC